MMEMLALFVGYFLYESNADNWWWTAYWIIVGLKVAQSIGRYQEKCRKDAEESRRYWEGK
jgi:hypothetical protein